MRTPFNRRIPISLDTMAAANGLRNPGDNQPESDRHLDQVWEETEVCYKFVYFNRTWKYDEMNLEHEYYAE